MQVLVHGNATEAEATKLADGVRKALGCAPLPNACATMRRGVILEQSERSAALNPNNVIFTLFLTILSGRY